MTKLSLIAVAALPLASQAFAPVTPAVQQVQVPSTHLFAEVDDKASEAVFLAPDESKTDDDVAFAKAESLGRGAAKVSFGFLVSVSDR